MRVIFCGTSDYAAELLAAIKDAGYDLSLVLTQPDRPAGRGMSLRPTPVKVAAENANLAVITPNNLSTPEIIERLSKEKPDIIVVIAYGLLIPDAILKLPQFGCVNVHASLLPRWRGAAPIERAILAGDRMTGVSIMKMDAGLDTGPVYRMVPIPIYRNDTTDSLREKLVLAGKEGVLATLADFANNTISEPVAQDNDKSTYAAKINKQEAIIDWGRSAVEIDRQIRAFNPQPGAKTTWKEGALKIWEAEPHECSGKCPHAVNAVAGEIVKIKDGKLIVKCGEGMLAISTLQRAGGKKMPVEAFLQGAKLTVGEQFGG